MIEAPDVLVVSHGWSGTHLTIDTIRSNFDAYQARDVAIGSTTMETYSDRLATPAPDGGYDRR